MFEKSVFDRELQTLDALAPMGYFLGLHIRFTAPLMTLQTYDQAWMDHYTENGGKVRIEVWRDDLLRAHKLQDYCKCGASRSGIF